MSNTGFGEEPPLCAFRKLGKSLLALILHYALLTFSLAPCITLLLFFTSLSAISNQYSAFIKEREEKVLEKKSSGRKRLLTMRKYNALNNMKICCERLQEACWISPSPPNLIFLNPSPLPPYRSDQQTKSSSNSKQTPTLNQP